MVYIWTEIQKKIKNKGYIHMRWLIRTKARWRITETIRIPRRKTKVAEEVRKAKETLRRIRAKAPELREEFLDDLIRQAEDAGDEQKAKEIRQIRERERMRKAHTRIKAAQGKLKGGGGEIRGKNQRGWHENNNQR